MKIFYNAELERLNALNGDDFIPEESQKNPEVSQIEKTTDKIKSTGKKSKAFEQDYPTFLLSLASTIRTGLDPISAIKSVTEMMTEGSVLKQELKKLTQKLDSGDSEEDAILSFGDSIGHPDISLLTTSLLLARKEGSSLGACLQRLNKVTRHRQSFRRKAKAAIAMQKLSSFGIVGCSLLIGVIQISMNPDNFFKAWSHPLGGMLILFGLVLSSVGITWMLYLGRDKV